MTQSRERNLSQRLLSKKFEGARYVRQPNRTVIRREARFGSCLRVGWLYSELTKNDQQSIKGHTYTSEK